jgi:hypothetical protein
MPLESPDQICFAEKLPWQIAEVWNKIWLQLKWNFVVNDWKLESRFAET